MRDPSLRTSRRAIAVGLIAAAVMGAAGFYVGRTTSSAPVAPAEAPATSGLPLPTLPTAEPLLNRADIIGLAGQAADAAASGEELPARVREVANRRFELAVPFGCGGAAEADSEAPMRWRYDEQNEVLRVHVAVTRIPPSEWGLAEAAEGEAIEGFWIARPWSSSDECPPRRAQSEGEATATGPQTAPEQTLAVAQFFRGDVRREALRERRPFEVVRRVARTDFAAPRGFRLILSGRIDRVPGDGPVRCLQPAGIEQRPRCIVAVTLDEVRIENPANGEVLASWALASA